MVVVVVVVVVLVVVVVVVVVVDVVVVVVLTEGYCHAIVFDSVVYINKLRTNLYQIFCID